MHPKMGHEFFLNAMTQKTMTMHHSFLNPYVFDYWPIYLNNFLNSTSPNLITIYYNVACYGICH
jgi:hypothetical protein